MYSAEIAYQSGVNAGIATGHQQPLTIEGPGELKEDELEKGLAVLTDPVKDLGAPGVVWALLWSPDGKSLQYSFSQNGAYNILEQPLTGGEPRRLTKFSSGIIFDIHWGCAEAFI